MKYRIYSDLHIFGKIELNIKPYGHEGEEIEVYLGDNIELKNCLKKDLKDATASLSEMYDYYLESKGVFVSGNHELFTPHIDENYNKIQYPIAEKRNNVLFTHGDLGVLWKKSKGKKFRRKSPGCSKFKYKFIVPLIEKARKLKPFKIKQKHMDAAFLLAKTYGVDTIVCGHGHPESLIIKKQSGVTLVVVPRGVTHLDL